ncbi:ATP-dependent DNA helicase [Dyadobacter fermentans]|uniref:DNA 3'-5' helicase n=1 Tax=Dyadobacter fermentans (strain ATCC 700827 / DSM 18053 / CIP 107007 / KCTC 52180 / NS114) TaxID=471854 RepID=C6W379_DYAFD|nr:ATP-dependent DNA helicase [Dyadobacter fermentans]ACT92183.1 UvrD/REP helicase [Dyadobacter fermentans DSM 18053]
MLNFTPDQQRAISENDKNLRIIACAGSGKTSTVAAKITHLLLGENNAAVEPRNIIAFTYTEKAAAELRNKVLKTIKEDDRLKNVQAIADMYIGTIHGWCLKALQENEYQYQKFSVLDDIKLRLFVDKNYKKIGMSDVTKVSNDDITMQIFVDTKRFIQLMNVIRESELDGELPSHIVLAKQKYEGLLKENCYFDFTMIMTEAIDKLQEKRDLYNKIKKDLKYLIVDEYQDINPIQGILINQLYQVAKPVITVVGDDDQNIYQWRGSNSSFIKDFLHDYEPAHEIILDRNFRSSKGVTALAETIISRNDRIPKSMISAEKQTFSKNNDVLYNEFVSTVEENGTIAQMIVDLRGTPFKSNVTDPNEPERGLDYSDFAILLRTWSKTAGIVNELEKLDIPYITAGVNQLFSVNEVKAAYGIFQYLNKSISAEELLQLWIQIRNSNFASNNLLLGIEYLNSKFPEKQVDRNGKAIWAFSLQQIYWDFLEKSQINEEAFQSQHIAEIVMYNLGKFSQVINDFEEIYFNSSVPSYHLFSFLQFIRYAAADHYPEGWLNNPFRAPNAVQIMTIHQAKGLEFPVVFIPGLNKNYMPAKKVGGLTEWHFLNPALIKNQQRYIGSEEDERRLFYVAITRAQKFLFISRAPDENNQLYRKASQFVSELAESDAIVTNLPPFEKNLKIEASPKKEAVSITLNFSVLKDFFECQYRFKLVSMYNFSYPLDQRMGFGRSLHNTLMEIHKRSKLGEELSQDDVLDIANGQSHFPYLGKSTILEQMKDLVKERVAEYYKRNKDSFKNIEYVEQEIQLNLDNGILVTGKIDLIRRKLYEDKYETTIIEFKSKQDVQNQKITYDQLNLYALGHKELTGQTADYIQIYDLEYNTQLPPKSLREDNLEETNSRIQNAAAVIRSQTFSRIDKKEVCKDCLQYHICHSGIKYNS